MWQNINNDAHNKVSLIAEFFKDPFLSMISSCEVFIIIGQVLISITVEVDNNQMELFFIYMIICDSLIVIFL